MQHYVCFDPVFGGLHSVSSSSAIAAPDGFVIEEREGALPQSLDWWDQASRKFVKPEPRIITRLEFISRLNITERVAIREAAKTDQILADIMELLSMAEEINLDDPRTNQSIGYMASVGLITPSRMTEILG